MKSDAKAAKVSGMKNQFEKGFEEQLQNIQKSISSKGGIKKIDKVYERRLRAKEKYPSIHQYYNITVSVDEQAKQATEIEWDKDHEMHQTKEDGLGIYFLRTNLPVKDEVVIWKTYNTIREIENSFRLRTLLLSALCVKKKRDVFILPWVKDNIIEINGLMAKNVFTLRTLLLSALCVLFSLAPFA